MLRNLPEVQMRPKEEPEAGMIPEGGTVASDPQHILPERVDHVGWAMLLLICRPARTSAPSEASQEPLAPQENPANQARQ